MARENFSVFVAVKNRQDVLNRKALPFVNKHVVALLPLLDEAGWLPAGATSPGAVRFPIMRNTVCVGAGGELRSYGNRLRFRKGDFWLTVGPKKVCRYRVTAAGPRDFETVASSDLPAVRALLEVEI